MGITFLSGIFLTTSIESHTFFKISFISIKLLLFIHIYQVDMSLSTQYRQKSSDYNCKERAFGHKFFNKPDWRFAYALHSQEFFFIFSIQNSSTILMFWQTKNVINRPIVSIILYFLAQTTSYFALLCHIELSRISIPICKTGHFHKMHLINFR